MNRVYRIIWSKSRNAWMVVSELAAARGKSKSRGVRRLRTNESRHGASLMALALGTLAWPVAAANYNVADEAALRQAIIDASADSDASSTITLTGNIALTDPSAFAAITKTLTINTGAFSLSAPASISNTPGLGAVFPGGPLTLQGRITGGDSGDAPGSNVAGGSGGVGLTLGSGTLTNQAAVRGGVGADRTYLANVFAGTGGAGMVLNQVALTNTATGAITGGAGGSVDYQSDPGAHYGTTGKGGIGLALTNGSLTNSGSITGGVGGASLNVVAFDKVWGGNGGVGAELIGGNHLNTSTGFIVGGVGGTGANTPGAGSGTGGVGLILDGGAYLTNLTGSIFGGNGGADVAGGRGGTGGVGAVVGNGSTLQNEGTVLGGSGGGTGAAGIGIVGTGGATVINRGQIRSGRDPSKPGATAIQFTGGNNRLELWSAFTIIGNVVASASDTLALGGTFDSSFNVSLIGPAAQYRDFGKYEKTGASTWALTGTTTTVTPWTLKEGTLSIADDNSLGAAGSTLNFDGGILQITGTTNTSTTRTINWSANGGGFDIAAAANTYVVSQNIASGGALTKLGAGTLVLSGNNGYSGGTTVSAGTLVLTGNNSNTGGTTTASAGTLQLGDGGTSGWLAGDITNNGKLVFNRSDAATFAGAISGAGGVTQAGTGVTTLTGASQVKNLNVTAGELRLAGGATVQGTNTFTVGGSGAVAPVFRATGLGTSLDLSGQTLSVGSGSNSGVFNLEAGAQATINIVQLSGTLASGKSAVINVSGGDTLLTMASNMVVGTSAKAGSRTEVNVSGGATVNALSQTLGQQSQIGASIVETISGQGTRWSNSGSVGLLVHSGAVNVLDGATYQTTSARFGYYTGLPLAYTGSLLVSGNNARFISSGAVTAGTSNTTTGVITLSDGGYLSAGAAVTLAQVASATGVLNIGAAATDAARGAGTLDASSLVFGPGTGRLIFNHTHTDFSFGAALSGNGTVNHLAGVTKLTGNSNGFSGTTNVIGGTLRVNGTLGSAVSTVNVGNGGTLGGSGTIGGNVSVSDGVLAPGNSPGSLTINGNLSLGSSSVLDFELGQAGVVGGALNDHIAVNGDLVLDGTLNVRESAGGIYGVGVYRLIDYSGALTDNGLDLGLMPAGGTQYLQTSIAHQVNLVNTSGLTLNYWDGDTGIQHDGVITGGNGTWSAAGDEKWTDANGRVNAPYTDGAFVVFAGGGGTVSVDDSEGAINVSGMQFAVDGYRIEGDAIVLGTGSNALRVGDGSAAGANYVATIDAELTGSGQLDKTDLGTLVLTGANNSSGGTRISGGTLQLGDGGNSGSLLGDVLNNGILAFNRADGVSFDGVISGSGALRQIGTGSLILTGDNTFTGGTRIDSGSLQIGDGGTRGTLVGDVLNNGALAFDRSDRFSFGGIISGMGIVEQRGAGTTVLTGNSAGFGGSTSVNNGALLVNGTLGNTGGTTAVHSGATLGGTGRLGGAVTVANGGILAPGNGGAGTLTTGDLTLAGGALLNVELGARQATGGMLNDLIQVNGNLVLGGTLNVAETVGGSFGLGVYRLVNYTGSLTDNTLAVGAVPAGSDIADFYVQTVVAHQVNLINTGGLTFRFWDGPSGHDNGLFDGGTGTWLASSNNNWTALNPTANAPWTNDAFSVFQGGAGHVAVDDADGAVNFTGIQFMVDGYRVSGDALNTQRAETEIRVGDGSVAGAAMTATLDASIAGSGGLVKTDAGTLILGADNVYTGNTAVRGGVLQIARDANLGAANGELILDGGTLRVTSDLNSARTVRLQAGGDIDTREHTVTLSGSLSGAGDWAKRGTGTLVLAGANTASGTTTVAEGELRAGAVGAFGSSASFKVGSAGALSLKGFSQTVSALSNAGTVSVENTSLTVTGDYAGDNGVLRLAGNLGSDNSTTGRLIMDGGTATGHTRIALSNVGGLGAKTTGNGIELVSAVNGATTTAQTSRDAFALQGEYVEAGAFEYRLHAGDLSGNGESWYLRSNLPDASTPEPTTTYRREVALYAALPSLLAQSDLNMLGTLHGREGDDGVVSSAEGEGARVWMRGISRSQQTRQHGTVSQRNDADIQGWQIGVDLAQTAHHRLGAYGGRLNWESDVNGFASGIDNRKAGRLDGHSNYLGAYWTYAADAGWYSDLVLQQGWHDGDAQSGGRGDVSGSSTQLALEMGKALRLSTHWLLEPQAQLIASRQQLDSKTIPAARIAYDDDYSATARLGTRLVGDFTVNRDHLQPYARLNVWHGLSGTDTMTVTAQDSGKHADIRSARGYSSADLALGATWRRNTVSVYGEVGRQLVLEGGSDQEVKALYSASLGVRVTW